MLARPLLAGAAAALIASCTASAAEPIAEVHLPGSGDVVTKIALKAGQVYPMEISGTRKKDRAQGSTHYVQFQDAFFCYDAGEDRLDFECPDPKAGPGDVVAITARTSEGTTRHPLGEFLTEGEPSRINPAWKHPPYKADHRYSVGFRPKLSGKLTLSTRETCDGPICSGAGYDVKLFEPVESEDPCAAPAARTAAVNEVRAVAVQQGVAFRKAGTPEDAWNTLCKDTVLQQGDEISCDPDGAATLQFADNSTVVVRNTTQLKIASFFTEGGVVKTEILLKMGEIAAKVHKSEATKSDFRIKSPTSVASVRGTDFTVAYDPGGKATVTTVREGVVEVDPVQAGLKTVSLTQGQEIEVTSRAMSKIGKPGKAGARGGLSRFAALAKVLGIIAKADRCKATTPRSNAFAVKPGKDWAITVKLTGGLKGTSKWTVKGRRATARNALAKKLARRCR
jgi:hypothetical protein